MIYKYIVKILKLIFIPTRFKYIRKYANKNKKRFKILDVGCGNGSPDLTRKYLEVDIYDGIDNYIWENDESSYIKIDNFYKIDLDKENINIIKDNYYDVIIVSHVIEHLMNGENLIKSLCTKLNNGGIIYIETPNPKTINYPRAVGFLNFYDDATHLRCYFDADIIKTLQKNEIKVIKYGCRSDYIKMILLAPMAVISNITYWIPFKKMLCSHGLWDIMCVTKIWIGMKR